MRLAERHGTVAPSWIRTSLLQPLEGRDDLLADRIGPRLPMTAGPLGMAAGLALLSRVQEGATYVGAVLPGVVMFGLGLALTVAPLTATVLAAAPARHAGVASGVNNAVAVTPVDPERMGRNGQLCMEGAGARFTSCSTRR